MLLQSLTEDLGTGRETPGVFLHVILEAISISYSSLEEVGVVGGAVQCSSKALARRVQAGPRDLAGH